MLIPHTQIDPQTLDELMTDYVTRDGTADGTFTTLAERKSQLLEKLEREEAFITFNREHQQACLIPRHEAPADALLEFESVKQSLSAESEDAAYEAKCRADFELLYGQLAAGSTFPIALGRTVQSRGVYLLQEEGKASLEDLQAMLHKHSLGDYGLVSWSDKLKNLKAIPGKEYMLSRYEVRGQSLCVEMMAGHSHAMVRLRSEY